MSPDPVFEKVELRRRLRGAVKVMSTGKLAQASRAICSRLERAEVWRTARSILAYLPFQQEPDILPSVHQALREGKRVALPRYNAGTALYEAAWITNFDTDLISGMYGIMEPKVECSAAFVNQLDFVLVPGIGFGLNGCRLGRGRGYMDRLLAHSSATKCGVAFDDQVVPQVPWEPHDVLMNHIVTPTRWLDLAVMRAVS